MAININITESELITGLVFCIVLSFFFNPLESFSTKVKDALTKVEVFKPTKKLQIKDEILVQMLDENGKTKINLILYYKMNLISITISI